MHAAEHHAGLAAGCSHSAVHHGEVDGLAQGELLKRALLGLGHAELLHHFPVLQHVGAVAVGAEELLGGNLALGGDHRGAQGHERRRRVVRGHGEAAVVVAEDGVVAVVADAGRAGGAALAPAVEAVVGHAEVPAAVHLADVAADRAHVADGGRRHTSRRLSQRRGIGLHQLVLGHIGQLRQGADAQRVAVLLDGVHPLDGLQIDDGLGVLREDLVFQGAQKIGAAGHDPGLPACRLFRGLIGRGGLHVLEMLHGSILL